MQHRLPERLRVVVSLVPLTLSWVRRSTPDRALEQLLFTLYRDLECINTVASGGWWIARNVP